MYVSIEKTSCSSYTIKRIFVIGSPPPGTKVPQLEHEVRKFHDILQDDLEDTYRNCGHKVFSAFDFIKHYCQKVPMVVVADDDAMLIPWNYLPAISKVQSALGNRYSE